MKRRKGIVFCLLLVCAALAAGRVSTPEQRTIRYFDRHRTALEEDALRTVETDEYPAEPVLRSNWMERIPLWSMLWSAAGSFSFEVLWLFLLAGG